MDRMEQHYTILSYLFLAMGALVLLSGIVVATILGGAGALSGDAEAVRVLGAVTGMLWIILLVISIPYLAAGYGLLKRFAWGRVLAMVMGALSLLSVPIGTALGIYTLWALTRPDAQEAFV